MPIIEPELWQKCQDNNQDPYGNACVMTARRVMELLDSEVGGRIDAYNLVNRADNESGAGGITGYMAGCVANIVAGCHSRGDEFRKAWNHEFDDEERDGVINPALLTTRS